MLFTTSIWFFLPQKIYFDKYLCGLKYLSLKSMRSNVVWWLPTSFAIFSCVFYKRKSHQLYIYTPCFHSWLVVLQFMFSFMVVMTALRPPHYLLSTWKSLSPNYCCCCLPYVQALWSYLSGFTCGVEWGCTGQCMVGGRVAWNVREF